MATPQLEDGYTQIANEILEILTKVNLSAYEWRILIFIIRKTYGWKKKEDWISLSQFSKGTNLDRRHAHRAIKSLLNKKIVVISTDDKKHPRYGFNKDYERWKLPCMQSSTFQQQMEADRERRKERRKKKSTSTDDKIVPLQAPTKETITKETLKKKEERKEERECEREKTTSLLKNGNNKPLRVAFRSKEWLQIKEKDQEAQKLHKWLVKEQADYIKEHGVEGFERLNWKQYVESYYRR